FAWKDELKQWNSEKRRIPCPGMIQRFRRGLRLKLISDV
ncbi:hypothetical protein GE061_015694, partial [Apolygus lucorum]